MSWEDSFRTWSEPPSDTEQEKCENAENIICKALNNDPVLEPMNISVFTQGSYKANTNIKLDSDVDICILNRNHIFSDKPDGATDADLGLIDSSLDYKDFKNMVEQALVKYFGRDGVTRGKKAFDIHANSYRIDADVVPAYVHRRYFKNANGSYSYISGIEFRPDDGGMVRNFPDQAYDNGVAKNNATSRQYKKIVRILKRLRNKMQDEGITAANNVASFLIESMVWNVPNNFFGHDTYKEDVRAILANTFNATLKQESCDDWREVSDLLYLFRDGIKPWTRQQAHNFVSAAWNYIGYQ